MVVDRVRRPLWRYLLKCTAVRYWGPCLLLIVLLNSFGRSWHWEFEWLWAVETLTFSSIFVAPFCAGVSAFEASKLAAARELLSVAPKGLRAVLSIVVMVWSTVVASVLLSIVFVGGWVLYRTAGLLPRWSDLVSLAPFVLFAALGCAVGVLLGWCFPAKVTPGLTAVGVFGFMMIGYVVGNGALSGLVSTGGASGSLVGLKISLRLIGWQSVLYLCLTLLAVCMIGLCVCAVSWRLKVCAALCAVTVAVSVVGVLGAGERYTSDSSVRFVCEVGHPQICLVRGYDSRAHDVRSALAPYYKALAVAGVEVPDRVVQGGGESSKDLLVVDSSDVVSPNDQTLRNSLISSLSDNNCAVWGGGRGDDPRPVIWDWFSVRVKGETPYAGSGVDLASMSTDQQDALLRESIHRLEQCR